MENLVAGMEGYKPATNAAGTISTDAHYWKGKRFRKKGRTKAHMNAANLLDLQKYIDTVETPSNDSFVTQLLGLPSEPSIKLNIDDKDRFLLRRAAQGNKISSKTRHRILSRYGSMLTQRLF